MMMKNRAKKGGEMGMNGEFYKGGAFLPSTQLPKQGTIKGATTNPKTQLTEYQIANINNAIEGTKKQIEISRSHGNLKGVEANEIYLETLIKKLRGR